MPPTASAARAVWIESWRHAAAAEMARVYRAEHARHVAALDWDTAPTWAALEHARTAGTVAGLVARDGTGAVAGWTYFVERAGELQVGAFTASAEAGSWLLDGLLETPEARRAARVRLFAHADAPDLAGALASRGFRVGAYHYLTAALVAPSASGTPVRPWRQTDLAGATDLMRAAYRDEDPLRPFGGAGGAEDWIEYVVALTSTPGCGVFGPDVSVVVPAAGGGLDAVALVTRLGPSMAHLAQLAVAPDARRRGLGARALAAAMGAATAAGLSGMSLLVSADNTAARHLYATRGFRYAATFVSAVADAGALVASAQPRRSMSAAWPSGGMGTRR